MRKYDSKNKRNIGVIVGVCIIFAVIFSFFLFKEIKISKINYVLESSTLLFDSDKNSILINDTGIIKKKWNKKYYLKYNDEQYNIGSHVIAFNNNDLSLYLYGEFYEVKSNSEVDITDEETIINNLGISKFYKVSDRKYLIIDPNIRMEDESLKTSNYLIVELDKQGNAILYNNTLNVKVFSASKIVTSNYTFDIANELLIFENETIDLKKIIGTTNEYKEKDESSNSKDDKGNSGNSNVNPGNGGNNGVVNNLGNNTNVNNPNNGNGVNKDNDIITNEGGTDIKQEEIINQTAYTSVIKIVPTINTINIDYVIYDKLNEYLNVYVEISSNDSYNVVHLSKTNTSISLTGLKPGTKYELAFKYKHLVNDLVKEETIDTHYVTTLLPNIGMTGTKVTSKAITYKISTSSYSIDSAKLSLYVNGTKQSHEISVSGSDLSGEYSISGVTFPNDALVELRLENIIISGVSYNRSVSWSYKYVSTSPNTPEEPDTGEEEKPDINEPIIDNENPEEGDSNEE